MFGLTPDTEVPTISLESKTQVKASAVKQDVFCEKEVAHVPVADIKSVMYKGADLNYVVHTILQCLAEVSERRYYGVTVLVDILRGSKNQRITNAELNALSTYGALVNISRDDLEFIIE